jgi:replicative DNA helicase
MLALDFARGGCHQARPAEARVPMHTMHTGQMNDDRARLARRMSEFADGPLFIDFLRPVLHLLG